MNFAKPIRNWKFLLPPYVPQIAVNMCIVRNRAVVVPGVPCETALVDNAVVWWRGVGMALVAAVLGVGQSRSMTICGCPPNLLLG